MTLVSVENRSILAIVSFSLGMVGFWILGLYVGPAAIICAIIALWIRTADEQIETIYIILAFIGLILGVYEIIFGILDIFNLLPTLP